MPPTPAAPPGRRRELRHDCAWASSTKRARLRRVRFGHRRPVRALRAELALRLAHPSTTDYVELKFLELAIENGFDFVEIYAGSTAPTGFSLTAPAAGRSCSTRRRASTLPQLVFAAPVFVTFESDGLGNTAVGATGDGGFAIEHKVAAKGLRGDWAPVGQLRAGPLHRRERACGRGRCGAAEVRRVLVERRSELGVGDGLPAMTTCRWKFTLPEATNLKGLSLRAKKASTWRENDETTWTRLWDVEASGALTSTTDAVKIYQSDNTLVGTVMKGTSEAGVNDAVWEFPLDGSPGDTYTAVFASDLNNPVPEEGL